MLITCLLAIFSNFLIAILDQHKMFLQTDLVILLVYLSGLIPVAFTKDHLKLDSSFFAALSLHSVSSFADLIL